MSPAVTSPCTTRLRCGFYLAKKKRRCGMTRSANLPYCSEHLSALATDDPLQTAEPAARGRRVPCPVDPRHSVWEKELTRHARKCGAAHEKRSRDAQGAWYRCDYNCGPPAAVVGASVGDATILAAIPIVQEIYKSFFEQRPLPTEIKSNEPVELRRFPQLLGSRKHARQQSSLIQHVQDHGMFPANPNDSVTYMEFGCGRAELSRYLNQSVVLHLLNASQAATRPAVMPSYVFIDRASNRMKFDKKIRDDVDELCDADSAATATASRPDSNTYPCITRKKIDIKDLYLDALVSPNKNNKYVVISKHLCGVATDLTIRCVLNSSVLHTKDRHLQGMVIAMCCRHVCDPARYANPSYIESLIRDHDVNYQDFFLALKKIATWAVCGRRPGMTDSDVNNHFTGLPVVDREKLGQMARRIIDEGRAQLLRDEGYNVSLVEYIESEVSLENVAMVVTKRNSASHG
ncbi:LAMI_0G07250g1_1 [Lachancea mirantina]|uniref:tRNA:m(4)X modification enzyme TRM13 n=1 Tax=Lachancea mirantina TaxID=1230905 RepID=A0A1G4K9P2_9SACH|nr:LAMI_0G07250g1_1 [Lachancea mirantina]